MPARRGLQGIDPWSCALLALTTALLAFDVWVVASWKFAAPGSEVAWQFVFRGSWVIPGAVAVGLRRSELARRILTLSALLAAALPGALGPLETSALARALVALSAVLGPLALAASAHLMMSIPSGRLRSRASRRVLAATVTIALCEGIWWTLQAVHAPSASGVSEATRRLMSAGIAVGWIVVIILICSRLVVRYQEAGERQRRLLRIPYGACLLAAAVVAALAVWAGRSGSTIFGVSVVATVVEQALALVIPLSVLVALIAERLSFTRIGELVVTLAGRTDADLEASLAVALGDPQLRLVFPVGDGFVDALGHRTDAPEPDVRTVVTVVGEAEAPLALLRHDRSLEDESALLTAAGSATRLVLENARLQAEVRSQLLEVRESRARIVIASNDARARLERDLHDGAQQRLLAIGIALRLLREQPGDMSLLDAADGELVSALAEMRDLASGIHPAVLSDLGIEAALSALVHRLGPPLALRPSPVTLRRFPAPIEAAAYFTAAEAVTNALKHASPTEVSVSVEDLGDRLVVSVRDDGCGGADATGAGLVGVRDRLATVDGRMDLRSPPGAGTCLMLEIPCA